MTLAERLAAIVQALPDSGAVTLPVSELRQWLTEDGAARVRDERTSTVPSKEDRWLSAADVADRIGTGVRYVYQHRKSFPFAKELPGGSVRFSERGLLRWMERNAA